MSLGRGLMQQRRPLHTSQAPNCCPISLPIPSQTSSSRFCSVQSPQHKSQKTTTQHQQLNTNHQHSSIRCHTDGREVDRQPIQPISSIRISRQPRLYLSILPAAVILASCTLSLLAPGSASASEVLSGGALVIMQEFLEYVQSLGAWGGVVFIVTIMFAEMIPLFPTQPLSLAGGLLFGPQKGAVLVLIGVTLAATNAFMLSRGVGRKLAQRMLAAEIGESSSSNSNNPVAAKLAEVQEVIKNGGFWKQLSAVLLLRLTPVVPFSASNYLLGLTPVQVPAFLMGTIAGMTPWSIAYASLGGASRTMLDGGMDLGTLLSDLSERSGSYTKSALILAAAVGVAAAIYFSIRSVQAAKTTDQV